MAFQFDHIVSAALLENVIPYLVINDIQACEVLASFSREAIEKSCAWYGVACRQMNAFAVKMIDRASKRDIKQFLPELLMAASMEPFPIPLATIRDASELAVILGKFQGNACSHVAKGGSLAKVLVGRFRFDDCHSSFDHAQMHLKKSMPDIVFSQTMAASVGWKHSSLEQDLASLALTMALGRKGNKMLLSAKLELEPEFVNLKNRTTEGNRRLVIEVRAMSSSLLLQVRDVKLKPDGLHYESGSGLCVGNCCSGGLDTSFAEGITCVLLVCDELDADRSRQTFGPLADSLNLDRVRSTTN